MDKTKIERKLKKIYNVQNICVVLLLICFAGMFTTIFFGFSDYSTIMFLIYFISIWVIAIFSAWTSYYCIKYKLSKDIAKMVIYQYINDLVYDPKASIVKSTLKDLKLELPHYNRIKASDHITGTYKGKSIEITDIRLIEKQRTSNNVKTSETVFLGPLIKVEAIKSISSPLTISPKKSFGKENIKTDNDTFNKQFDIYCDDEDNALFILDSQTIEKILALEIRLQGRVYLCFEEDGYLYCAINDGRDRFEGEIKHKTFADISNGFDRDMQYIMSLIDELIDMLDDKQDNSEEVK